MRSDRLFMIAGALATMTMTFVLVIVLVCALALIFSFCWLGVELANTPIPTPLW